MTKIFTLEYAPADVVIPLSVHVPLMADILEHSTDILLLRFLPQQQILNPPHRTFITIVIDEMVPATCISIKHSRRFDNLPAILTSLALEGVMSVARCIRSVLEQFAKRVQAEVAFDILG